MKCVRKIISLSIGVWLVLGNFLPSAFASEITVEVTARVPGCGDGVVNSGAGEECDGADLDGASCQSLGYISGFLSCTFTCTFDTSLCSMTLPGGSSGVSSGGYLPQPVVVSTSFLIFSGVSIPYAEVIVLKNGIYFTSGYVNSEGLFTLVVSNPEEGFYPFSFYSISPNKKNSEMLFFSHFVQEGVITRITNIHFVFPETEEIPSQISYEEIINSEREDQETPSFISENPLEIENLEQDSSIRLLREVNFIGFCYYKESFSWVHRVTHWIQKIFYSSLNYFTVPWLPSYNYIGIEYFFKKVSLE